MKLPREIIPNPHKLSTPRTVRYRGTRQKKLAMALKDAEKFLGHNFNQIFGALVQCKRINKNARIKVRLAYFACLMAGLEGLPATAMIKYAWKEK